ncbi:CaiB/BaiF CoA transferase family protein [Actinomadura algeriensis]|uniref:Crotonobetainyl-CoA:carnitine CoA-transferase CaiB-like acyl-CoA transferase n=1 Tax=Actinomadura algeriensis TaxID=1679523 RepID=A0ABR9JYH7_9ACTN|nr:CaiB/BaiF CoA-transferase family protein [Actinomadura algeriensis]MBE1535627.1 crotonobetainyl-CoA:carnitine CoA-transferase CaiB-like acyl-CoA transferase [Actinomadura algeriensis]
MPGTQGAGRPPAGEPREPLPLEGITVVALEQAVAAPFASRQLADLGARVVKVEKVDGGDFARGYDSNVRGGLGTHFAWLNRSKESVALDLKTEEGRAILDDLIAGADVFLQNLAPGAADRLGFGAGRLRERDPRLIVVDMSGYGSSGPYRDKRAYDMLVQAEAGLISVTGTPETPVKAGSPISDIAAGMYAFSGVLAALVRRGTTGAGASVEVSMFDAVAEWMSQPMYTTLYTGAAPPRARLSHPVIAPYDAYPTADGVDVVIGVQSDPGWAALAAGVLDRPDLVTDPDYATNMARVRNREKVDALVASVTSRLGRDELLRRLDEAGVPNATLNDGHGLVAHPQLAARDRWRDVGSPVGDIRALLPPITLAGAEPRMDPVPALGEHTDAVLAELGRDAGTVARLRAAGVVG